MQINIDNFRFSRFLNLNWRVIIYRLWASYVLSVVQSIQLHFTCFYHPIIYSTLQWYSIIWYFLNFHHSIDSVCLKIIWLIYSIPVTMCSMQKLSISSRIGPFMSGCFYCSLRGLVPLKRLHVFLLSCYHHWIIEMNHLFHMIVILKFKIWKFQILCWSHHPFPLWYHHSFSKWSLIVKMQKQSLLLSWYRIQTRFRDADGYLFSDNDYCKTN
jgi:hypothetical protein